MPLYALSRFLVSRITHSLYFVSVQRMDKAARGPDSRSRCARAASILHIRIIYQVVLETFIGGNTTSDLMARGLYSPRMRTPLALRKYCRLSDID